MIFEKTKYTDKNGKEIRFGDYLFYTERPNSNYADGLLRVAYAHDLNDARPICVVYNYKGTYKEIFQIEPEFKFHSKDINDPNKLLDVEIVYPDESDLVEWMNEWRPLGSSF